MCKSLLVEHVSCFWGLARVSHAGWGRGRFAHRYVYMCIRVYMYMCIRVCVCVCCFSFMSIKHGVLAYLDFYYVG
jgi:hypothetical protein